jgi:hypothetical protein
MKTFRFCHSAKVPDVSAASTIMVASVSAAHRFVPLRKEQAVSQIILSLIPLDQHLTDQQIVSSDLALKRSIGLWASRSRQSSGLSHRSPSRGPSYRYPLPTPETIVKPSSTSFPVSRRARSTPCPVGLRVPTTATAAVLTSAQSP